MWSDSLSIIFQSIIFRSCIFSFQLPQVNILQIIHITYPKVWELERFWMAKVTLKITPRSFVMVPFDGICHWSFIATMSLSCTVSDILSLISCHVHTSQSRQLRHKLTVQLVWTLVSPFYLLNYDHGDSPRVVRANVYITRCRTNETLHNWPALECRPPARPARRQFYRRQTTTTDASEQNNTGPLGGPVCLGPKFKK